MGKYKTDRVRVDPDGSVWRFYIHGSYDYYQRCKIYQEEGIEGVIRVFGDKYPYYKWNPLGGKIELDNPFGYWELEKSPDFSPDSSCLVAILYYLFKFLLIGLLIYIILFLCSKLLVSFGVVDVNESDDPVYPACSNCVLILDGDIESVKSVWENYGWKVISEQSCDIIPEKIVGLVFTPFSKKMYRCDDFYKGYCPDGEVCFFYPSMIPENGSLYAHDNNGGNIFSYVNGMLTKGEKWKYFKP